MRGEDAIVHDGRRFSGKLLLPTHAQAKKYNAAL